jgi:hypothetical protein
MRAPWIFRLGMFLIVGSLGFGLLIGAHPKIFSCDVSLPSLCYYTLDAGLVIALVSYFAGIPFVMVYYFYVELKWKSVELNPYRDTQRGKLFVSYIDMNSARQYSFRVRGLRRLQFDEVRVRTGFASFLKIRFNNLTDMDNFLKMYEPTLTTNRTEM